MTRRRITSDKAVGYQRLIFVVGVIFLGWLASFIVSPTLPFWYQNLNKPWFTPPNWVFGPVWTLLYGLMGYSVYEVCRAKKPDREIKEAVSVFGVQFGLNILWSFLFFGMHSVFLGLVGIIALWISIIGMMLMFYNIDKMSAYVQIPYLLWVTYALILTVSIYFLNV